MDRELLKRSLRLHEGVLSRRYVDTVGKVTIGCGHNISDDPKYPFTEAQEPLSDGQINQLLEGDIDVAIAELDENCNWWRAMEEPRQRVLAEMCFNLGWPRLSEFTNTLKLMHFSQYEAAAAGMLASKWAQQVKGRAVTLAEAMKTGVYNVGN